MRIITKDIRKGAVKIKTENMEDLWHLSHIIEPGDFVRGQTVRKIKLGKGDERKTQAVKKRVFVELKAEKLTLQDDSLRISGTISSNIEDIPKGSYHTIDTEVGDFITIIKERWLKFQIDKLNEATVKQPDIMICVLDRDEAIFAISRRGTYEILASVKGEVEKKAEGVKVEGDFYSLVIKALEEYSQRYKLKDIIVASPAFWKEELLKKIKDNELKKRIKLATCSSVDVNAINEILKRPEIREVIRQDRIAFEVNLVDELLKEVAKQNLAAYGLKETENAANSGAVRILLVTDSLIQKMRDKGNYGVLDNIMRAVEQTKGEVNIIFSEHDGGKKLDGLGGIGAILRYRVC